MLKLHFDFGHHATRKDAREMQQRLSLFRPHVYIMEEHFLSSPSGKTVIDGCIESFYEIVRELNDAIAKARVGDVWAIKALSELAKRVAMSDFKDAEYKIIIGAENLHLFFLETHGLGPALNASALRTLNEEKEAIFYLFKTDFNAALRHFRTALKRAANDFLVREENIAHNLSLLGDNLLKVFDDLRSLDELRVFVRYGLAHANIYDIALKGGMDATISYNQNEEPSEITLIRILKINKNAQIDDETLLRALIELTLATAIVTVKSMQTSKEEVDDEATGAVYKMVKSYMKNRPTKVLKKLFAKRKRMSFEDAVVDLGLHLVESKALKRQQNHSVPSP
jgi:hypothetical protein